MPMYPYARPLPGRGLDPNADYAESDYGQLRSAKDAFKAGLYTAAEGAARSADMQGVQAWAEKNAQEKLRLAQNYQPTGPQIVEDIESISEIPGFIGDKFVENLPQLGSSVGGALLGSVRGPTGALVGGLTASAPSLLGEVYGRQKELGTYDPVKMYAGTAANIAMEALPVGAMLGALRRMGKGTIARAVGTNVIAEGATEAAQGVVTDLAAGVAPNMSKEYLSARMNEAVAGGAVGGVVGAGAHALSYPGQALNEIRKAPGKAYDTVENYATGTLDAFRGTSPAEREMVNAQKAQKQEQFGFMGQAVDPAYLESGRNLMEQIQNKVEQGVPLTPFEEQAISNLSGEDTHANIISDKRKVQLDQLASDIFKGLNVETNKQIVKNNLNETEFTYIDAIINQLSEEESKTPITESLTDVRTDAAPQTGRRDLLEEQASKIWAGDLSNEDGSLTDETQEWVNSLDDVEYSHVNDIINSLEEGTKLQQQSDFSFDAAKDPMIQQDLTYNDLYKGDNIQDAQQTEAQEAINIGDEFEGGDLQFMQGSNAEGDFQDRPDASIADQYEKMANKHYLGTGQINEFNNKRWSETEYIPYPEKTSLISNNATPQKDIEKQDKELARLNESGQRTYRYISLAEALFNESLRDYKEAKAQNGIDMEFGDAVNDTLFMQLYQERVKEAATDIMDRSANKAGTRFYGERANMIKAGEYDKLIDLYQAIESEPKDIIDDYTSFDTEARDKIEVPLHFSNDMSKDTSKLSGGFIPLEEGKALNLPRAMKQRMQQMRKAGDTGLTKDEIYNQSKQDSTQSNEMQTLRRSALTSILSEYADRIGGTLINEQDVMAVTSMKHADDFERMEFIKALRKLPVTGEKSIHRFYASVKPKLEIPATPERTMEKGFIPLRLDRRHAPNKKTGISKYDLSEGALVLDLHAAVGHRQNTLARSGNPSTYNDALQSVMAEYAGKFSTTEPITLDKVIEEASVAMNWKEGAPGSKKTITPETGKPLLELTEVGKIKSEREELNNRVENLKTEQRRLLIMAEDPNMAFAPDQDFTADEKANWEVAKEQRKKLVSNMAANNKALETAEYKLSTNDEVEEYKVKTAIKSEQADFTRAREAISKALNTNNTKYLKSVGLYTAPIDANTRPEGVIYSEEELHTLRNMGINETVIDNGSYFFDRIMDTVNRVQFKKDKGQLDPRDFTDYQEVDYGEQGLKEDVGGEPEAGIGYQLGEEGITKPNSDAKAKADYANQQRTATEGAGQDDRSAARLQEVKEDTDFVGPFTKGVTADKAVPADMTAKLKAADTSRTTAESKRAKIKADVAADKLKNLSAEAKSNTALHDSISQRKDAIKVANEKIESILIKNNNYKSISMQLENFKKDLPYVIPHTPKPVVESTQETLSTTTTKKVSNYTKLLANSRARITEENQQIQNLEADIVRYEEGIKRATDKIQITPESIEAKKQKEQEEIANQVKPVTKLRKGKAEVIGHRPIEIVTKPVDAPKIKYNVTNITEGVANIEKRIVATNTKINKLREIESPTLAQKNERKRYEYSLEQDLERMDVLQTTNTLKEVIKSKSKAVPTTTTEVKKLTTEATRLINRIAKNNAQVTAINATVARGNNAPTKRQVNAISNYNRANKRMEKQLKDLGYTSKQIKATKTKHSTSVAFNKAEKALQDIRDGTFKKFYYTDSIMGYTDKEGNDYITVRLDKRNKALIKVKGANNTDDKIIAVMHTQSIANMVEDFTYNEKILPALKKTKAIPTSKIKVQKSSVRDTQLKTIKESVGKQEWKKHLVSNDLNKSLQSIIDDNKYPAMKVIAEHINTLIPENSVDIITNKDINTFITNPVLNKFAHDAMIIDRHPNGTIKQATAGFYTSPFTMPEYIQKDIIVINSNLENNDERTVLHESLHAALYKIIERSEQNIKGVHKTSQATDDLIGELNVLHKVFKIAFKNDSNDALNDLDVYDKFGGLTHAETTMHEFISVTMTDKRVQAYLRQIPYQRKTVWSALVEALRKILRIPKSEESAFTALLDIQSELLQQVKSDKNTRLLFSQIETSKRLELLEKAKSKPFFKNKKAITKLENEISRLDTYTNNIKHYNASLSIPKTLHGFVKVVTGKNGTTEISPQMVETQKLADRLIKGTGIKVAIVEGQKAEDTAKEIGIDDYKNGMQTGALHGFAKAVPNKDGTFSVYVNPAITGKLREEILAHELGHITMYGALGLQKHSSKEADAILKSYESWLTKYDKDDTLYRDLIASKKSPEAALLYLKSGLADYHMGALGKETKAYLRDFDEWYADEAGKALTRQMLEQSPRGYLQRYFDSLVKLLRRIFRKTTAVENYLMRLKEQTRVDAQMASSTYAKSHMPLTGGLKAQHTALNKAVSQQYNVSMIGTLKEVLLDKDYNLRDMKIPVMTELADLMHKLRGTKGKDNSYWQAKQLHMAKYDEQVTSIMRGATRDQQNVVMRELYNEKLPDSKVLPRTQKIRSLFKDLRTYMEDAGIEVKARKNYFPEVADVEYVDKNEEAFKDMMVRYPKEMASIAKKWNDDVKKRNAYFNRVTDPADLIDSADVPQALFDNIVNSEGVYDAAVSGQQTPNVRFLNHRIISFLQGRDKADWESNYLQSSVTDATSAYIRQTVKRVEYDKRFGKLNDKEQRQYINEMMTRLGQTVYTKEETDKFTIMAKFTNRLEWMMLRAEDEGATAKQIAKARNYVAAEMGTHGKQTAMWLFEKLGIPMPPTHSPINKTLQGALSGIMSVANVWVLGMSTLTSLADPIGIAVRTGSLSQAFSSFKVGLQASLSKDRSELKILAEAVGSISDIATKEALAHGYNMAYMTPAIKRMNDAFFHAIGLEQWTKTTRLMAVDAAQSFLKRHDNNPGKHSARFLEELGIQKGDIKYGQNGKVKVLTYEQYQDASEVDRTSDDRLKSAIAEFVDTAILRPNPSQRPVWASDPHFVLLFHLKSFMYSFQKTILNPLVHEAKNGNFMPLLMVGSYIPVMITVSMMKDIVKTAGDDDDNWTPTYKENWDVLDYMFDGAEKGGLFGIAQPIFDIRRSQRYGGSGWDALYSPGLDPDTFTQAPVPINYLWNNLTN